MLRCRDLQPEDFEPLVEWSIEQVQALHPDWPVAE